MFVGECAGMSGTRATHVWGSSGTTTRGVSERTARTVDSWIGRASSAFARRSGVNLRSMLPPVPQKPVHRFHFSRWDESARDRLVHRATARLGFARARGVMRVWNVVERMLSRVGLTPARRAAAALNNQSLRSVAFHCPSIPSSLASIYVHALSCLPSTVSTLKLGSLRASSRRRRPARLACGITRTSGLASRLRVRRPRVRARARDSAVQRLGKLFRSGWRGRGGFRDRAVARGSPSSGVARQPALCPPPVSLVGAVGGPAIFPRPARPPFH
jgi:hypothetical protein